MYTYTLRKELSVELGKGWVKEGRKIWALDRPCIFALQGSYRGRHDGRPGTDRVRRGVEGGEGKLHVHLFFGAWVVRGGVTGRPEFTPPYWYFAFFSEGFRIWKEHMRDSSTLIMPPALSNSPQ